MYRIFAMSHLGRIYALGIGGWVILNSKRTLNFSSVQNARAILYSVNIPSVLDGTDYLDSYIGKIDPNGELVGTFPILPSKAESEG